MHRVPTCPERIQELKWDAICIIARRDGVRLRSRNGRNWTDVFPSIVAAFRRLKVESAGLDGEVSVSTASFPS